MAKRPDTDWRIITAALQLGAAEGWRPLTMDAIAEAAKIKPDDLRARFASKRAILDGFAARIDQQVLDTAADDAETIRERLFDLIMCRFDALAPHKETLRAMLPDAPSKLAVADPGMALHALCASRRAMQSTLEAAGVGTSGLLGRAKIKLLMVVYFNALHIWLGDETGTMDKVMAQLDKSLARLEGLAETFLARRGAGNSEAAEAG
jgi:AcrR family transcriptional regulator